MPRKPYYGIIGNGETCALISPSASIDWLCLPRFDGNIVFSRALSPSGDSMKIDFLEGRKKLRAEKEGQSYIENTNILITKLSLNNFSVSVIDFMPWKGISEMISGKRFVYRIIRIKNISSHRKSLNILLSVKKGILKNMQVIAGSNFAFGISFSRNSAVLDPGESKEIFIKIAYGSKKEEAESLLKRAEKIDVRNEMQKTKEFWQGWLARGKKIIFKYADNENAYYRSLLVCKLLSYEKTGAFLAAPTASLSATPGGSENWDYRFCWIRDSYFVAKAFLKTGHCEEVEKLLDFFYSLQEKDGYWLTLYRVDGKKLGEEIELDVGGQVIRIGNEAQRQIQLDGPPSVLYLSYLFYLFTKDKPFLEKHWNKIVKAADWIVKNYSKPENGIWELRETEHRKKSHWIYGKVLCYAGLESAVRIAQVLGKPYRQWESARIILKAQILREGWSNQRKAFLQTYEEDSQVDISVLALEDYGLLSPVDSRIKRTVDLIEKTLVTKGFGVKRFEDAKLSFYLPTLWLATHYFLAGNFDRGKIFLYSCIKNSTYLFLCGEHFDPLKGEQHGNFPQSFNHAMMIEAILTLKEREYNLKILSALNVHFKVFADFLDRIRPKKELYLNKEF